MPRAGKEVDLVGRINGCFQRSMNGKPVPRDSEEMKAMVAYMEWLAQSTPKDQLVDIRNAGVIDESLVPDPEHGEQIYYAQCATCHGDNGEGIKDSRGDIVFPPLWGEESFNIGAGMARTTCRWAFKPRACGVMVMCCPTKTPWMSPNSSLTSRDLTLSARLTIGPTGQDLRMLAIKEVLKLADSEAAPGPLMSCWRRPGLNRRCAWSDLDLFSHLQGVIDLNGRTRSGLLCYLKR